MRNLDVVEAWAQGRGACSAHMATDGIKLLSYALIIGRTQTWPNHPTEKVAYDYTAPHNFVSMTTSCHVGLAKTVADRVENPAGDLISSRAARSESRAAHRSHGQRRHMHRHATAQSAARCSRFCAANYSDRAYYEKHGHYQDEAPVDGCLSCQEERAKKEAKYREEREWKR